MAARRGSNRHATLDPKLFGDFDAEASDLARCLGVGPKIRQLASPRLTDVVRRKHAESGFDECRETFGAQDTEAIEAAWNNNAGLPDPGPATLTRTFP